MLPLLAASTAACAVEDGVPTGDEAAFERSARRVVFLDFADGTHGVSAGASDDATRDVSQLCATTAFAPWEAPEDCEGGDRDACRLSVLTAVRGLFADFDVAFTTERPRGRSFTTIVVAPPDPACSFGRRGVAFADCHDESAVSLGMVFDCHADALSCALLIAHETGHTFGLVHSLDPADLMTPSPEDPALRFLRSAAATEPNPCAIERQGSYDALLRALGPRSPSLATACGR